MRSTQPKKYKTAEDKHNKPDNWSKQGPLKIKVARNVLKRKKSQSGVNSMGGQFLVPKTIHTHIDCLYNVII